MKNDNRRYQKMALLQKQGGKQSTTVLQQSLFEKKNTVETAIQSQKRTWMK